MTNHVRERVGSASMILTCPTCGWSGLVYYSHRRPIHCSNACKQKAYRQRRQVKNVTPSPLEGVTNLTRRRIEHNLDQALHILQCDCRRSIWTVRGNIQIGKLYCNLCKSSFRPI